MATRSEPVDPRETVDIGRSCPAGRILTEAVVQLLKSEFGSETEAARHGQ